MRRDRELQEFLVNEPLASLMGEAARLRDEGHGRIVSYSRKVFIPLTRLCRNVCHYCTFATAPRETARPFLLPEEVLDLARQGERAGCREALFTLGDRPEARYGVAQRELARLGYPSTLAYLAAMCDLVLRETRLLPHLNAGVMSKADLAALRRVSVSQGLMLESAAERLCSKGEVHHGSPDKHPAVRLAMLRAAGELRIPMTSGVLIGIGETREERVDSLIALACLHREFGHLQEIIIQNFRAKPGTLRARAPEPDLDELCWSVAVARIVFGAAMSIQAPPNLTPRSYPRLLLAGINDWGGISPVTPDHVNPEAPWPQVEALRSHTEAAGNILLERLAVYPSFARDAVQWQDPGLAGRVLGEIDAGGWPRTDDWAPGLALPVPGAFSSQQQPRSNEGSLPISSGIARILARACEAATLDEAEIASLFEARGDDFEAVCAAADELRRSAAGDVVRYVVTRNINYTNVCAFHCQFCAFSKATKARSLRGPAYDLDEAEVARRTREAWMRGATEVCMQGGIHPAYTGNTYLSLLRAVKKAVPPIHVHAFSPLEVVHGARSLGVPVPEFLARLKDAGLGSLPGTAAEVLDDEVRAVLCPDKLKTREWLAVIETAHRLGLRTTSTIMFGHVDKPVHWARHLLAVRMLQERTGGFSEFVPLPFVHMEAPIYFKGRSRRGPSFREAVLMHAVARLALHPVLPNIQVSWVKMGAAGARACLQAGASDLGGTLMNESISRAAGTQHGQELAPERMDELICSLGRLPQQRTTLYGPAPELQRMRSYAAAPLVPVIQTPLRSGPRAGAAASLP